LQSSPIKRPENAWSRVAFPDLQKCMAGLATLRRAQRCENTVKRGSEDRDERGM
jgi:hypothetical protein